MTLANAQVTLVRDTFRELEDDTETKSVYFYERLFHRDPELRPLFRDDIADQGMRFMSTLSVIVEGLDSPGQLGERYGSLGKGHRALGVKARHFVTMELALIDTMERFLGDDFTPEVKEAWSAAFREISAAIIAAGGIPA